MADPTSLTQSSTGSNNPVASSSTSTESLSSATTKTTTSNDADFTKTANSPVDEATTTATTSGNTPQANLLKHYNTIKSHLPTSISTRLPSEPEASQTLDSLSTKLSTLSSTSSVQLNEFRKTAEVKLRGTGTGLKEKVGEKVGLSKDQFLTQAWSVENGTQVVLNVSLNQVSPLFYEVVPPNSIFERRVPNVWFTLSIKPYTTSSSALTSWDVTWPILALTGPVSATVSILAVPFAALAVGGAALSSLTGFGATVGSGLMGSVSTVGKTGASAVALVGRASRLPGGEKVKGKLVDAGKKLLVGSGGEYVREKVVKYLAGSAGSVTGATGPEKISTEVESDLEERKREKLLEERKGKKFEEVEVTGFELVKVLKCETGKKSVDQALISAFSRLSFKAKGFKTSDNPVLRIVAGPELEERGSKQYLVFYPFIVENITNITVIPLPISETPPNQTEEALIRDTRIVQSVEEAEVAKEGAPKYCGGDKLEAKKSLEEKEKEEKTTKRSSWWGF